MLLGAAALAAAASGATFVVTTTTDDNGPCLPGDCSLREAILAANALPGMDTVEIPAGTYQLSIPENLALGGDLDITDDLELMGVPGATMVIGTGLGTPQDRVFDMTENAIAVVISGLEITGGNADLGGGVRISAFANVELIDCHVHGNVATQDGGGIRFAVSELTLTRTTVSDNVAERHGGGIRRSGAGGQTETSLRVSNSTISGNTAAFEGGAMYSLGDGGEIVIENSTIVDNQAGTLGSLIYQDFSIGPQFQNSILEGDCFFVSSQFPMSLGGNVGKDADFCFLDEPTDQDGVTDLGILPLGAYGGPTPTHDLVPGSPAVDSGLLAVCPTADQRGEARPVDGDLDEQADCDAGSVEVQLAQTPVAVPVLSGAGLAILGAVLAWAAFRRLV